MTVNWRSVRAIAIKDLKEVRQNSQALGAFMVVPLFFVVIIPIVVCMVPRLFSVPMDQLLSENGPAGMMLSRLPSSLAEQVAGLNQEQMFDVMMLGFFFLPFLLIEPLMMSSTVGADSFAGEKERKTMEALLYTPATDLELFLGKVLAAVIPAVLAGWISFAVYAVVVNAASWPAMGRLWFPSVYVLPLIFWVTPAMATLGIAVAVIVSSRVKTFMDAYQLTGSLVVVVLALVAAQMAGVVLLSVPIGILVGLVLWLVAGVLICMGVRGFARSELITRV